MIKIKSDCCNSTTTLYFNEAGYLAKIECEQCGKEDKPIGREKLITNEHTREEQSNR